MAIASDLVAAASGKNKHCLHLQQTAGNAQSVVAIQTVDEISAAAVAAAVQKMHSRHS